MRIQTERPTQVTDFTDNGKCIGCGSCCSNFLPITDDEITTIKRYISTHKVIEHHHGTAVFADPPIDAICPFLDSTRPDKRKCTIYPVRPGACRIFNCSSFINDQLTASARIADANIYNVRELFFHSKRRLI